MPYYWIFVKPDVRLMDPTEQAERSAVTERVQDVDTSFNIDPEAGILLPGKTACFVLTFAPSQVRLTWKIFHLNQVLRTSVET